MSERISIRKSIRAKRNQLSSHFQIDAAQQLVEQLKCWPSFNQAEHIALYLANDGELDLTPLINHCWQLNKQVYLPVMHPFNSNYLIFVRYHAETKMRENQFGILEPLAQPKDICPIQALDLLFTPLVAFDSLGNRLGMGGGFYDRTLAPLFKNENTGPKIIGLAHDCQQVEKIPVESWDVPIPIIITPTQQIICR